MGLGGALDSNEGAPYFYTTQHDDPRWLPLLERFGTSPAHPDALELHLTLRRN